MSMVPDIVCVDIPPPPLPSICQFSPRVLFCQITNCQQQVSLQFWYRGQYQLHSNFDVRPSRVLVQPSGQIWANVCDSNSATSKTSSSSISNGGDGSSNSNNKYSCKN